MHGPGSPRDDNGLYSALIGSRSFKVKANDGLVLEPLDAQMGDVIEVVQFHFVRRDDDDRGAADIFLIRTGVVNQ